MDWDPVSDLRSFTRATQDLDPEPDLTVLAIYTTAGIYQGEVGVDSATGPLTILNPDRFAMLGVEADFILRGYSERGGFRSLDFDEITVRKV